MAASDYLSVKKGSEKKLPIANTNNCLYVCDNGNLYYGIDANGKLRINKQNKENTIGNGITAGYGYANKYNMVINSEKESAYREHAYVRSKNYIDCYEIKLIDSTKSNPNKATLKLVEIEESYFINFGEYDFLSKPNPEPLYDSDGEINTSTTNATPSYSIDSPYIIKIYANNIPLEHKPLFYYNGIFNNNRTINNKEYLYSEDLVHSPFVQTEDGTLDYNYRDAFFLDLYKKNKQYFDKPSNYDNIKDDYYEQPTGSGRRYRGSDLKQLTAKNGVILTLKFFKVGSNGKDSLIIGDCNTICDNDSRQVILCGNHLTDAIGPTYTTPLSGLVVGAWNNPASDRGYVITVGNGTDKQARSNSFGVTPGGQVYCSGTYSGYGADYAEYFEWEEIPQIKDTRGLFVTLNKNKIRLANKDDKYILGAISSTPGIIGNTQSEEWQGKYKTDIFGEKIKDENGDLILNPDYNNDLKYTPREERPEWAMVGLVGQIIMVDDGTCEEGSFCYPGENGIATAAEKGYYVMERLDDNHIKVLFK